MPTRDQRDLLYVRSLFRPEDLGGNRYPWEVTRRLAARGHRVRVITPRPDGPLPGRTDAELMTYPVSRRTPLETFVTNAVGSRIATELAARRSRPDAVFVSSYETAFSHAVSRPLGVPLVFIYHSHYRSDAVRAWASARGPQRSVGRPATWFLRHVERRVLAGADKIVAVSPFSAREIVERWPAGATKLRVIPTGVDTQWFRPGDKIAARARVGLRPEARLLLFVGRLAPVKRVDRAIEALAILRQTDPRYELLIVGRGPEEATLRARVRDLGLDGAVRFDGFHDAESLRDRYIAADVQVCTSEFENWSLALLEGLACGIPVVGVPAGGIPELLGDVDPRLVARGCAPTDVADCIQELANGESYLAGLGRRSRAVATERYDWEIVVERLLEVVDEVAS